MLKSFDLYRLGAKSEPCSHRVVSWFLITERVLRCLVRKIWVEVFDCLFGKAEEGVCYGKQASQVSSHNYLG